MNAARTVRCFDRTCHFVCRGGGGVGVFAESGEFVAGWPETAVVSPDVLLAAPEADLIRLTRRGIRRSGARHHVMLDREG